MYSLLIGIDITRKITPDQCEDVTYYCRVHIVGDSDPTTQPNQRKSEA